jgi:rhamnosyltransferase
MKVSVIIPTRNGGKNLERLLKALGEQTFRPEQVFVVDSSSDDDTLKICRDYGADLIQIDIKAFDHGGTRNLAATRAIGDVLVFLTQDAVLKDNECLKNLIYPLEDAAVGASYGRQIPKEDANLIERFVRGFNYPSSEVTKGIEDLPDLGIKTFFFSNVCSAIKKMAYEEVGGFPDKTITNEDMFLAAKLLMNGYKIAYQPHAVIYHSHNYSFGSQFKRYFDIGVFFNRNRWIKDVSKSEKEGVRYLKEVLKFLFDDGQWNWIPYVLVDATARFLGYRVGLLEQALPLWIKKKISYNKNFWNNNKVPPLIDRRNQRF